MDNKDLIPQLYRQEYSKMVSLLCCRFGIDQIDAAEDIVSETFLSAAETWGQKGIPDNPAAWLYKVARNNALNSLRHDRIFRDRVRGAWVRSNPGSIEPDLDISDHNITDSQLRMLFAVCHPSIPIESQVSLALRVLCGFTIDEIARALLTNKATVNKRLYRAKERLRSENIRLSFPDTAALDTRLDAVLITLYLLFNEGYYSASPDKILRKDLCIEAMRLTFLLTGYPGQPNAADSGTPTAASGTPIAASSAPTAPSARPDIYSLLALMCFQASRFDARLDSAGGLILYEQQDSSRWDTGLINRGNYFFVQGCVEGVLSRYHLEAAIAWWHTRQDDSPEKWNHILMLYNRLLLLEYSPIAALNRAYAFSRVYGQAAAIPEAESLHLSGNLFYHSLLGYLYTGIDNQTAVHHFRQALDLAPTPAEKAILTEKLAACQQDPTHRIIRPD